jgi:hypothetical protein
MDKRTVLVITLLLVVAAVAAADEKPSIGVGVTHDEERPRGSGHVELSIGAGVTHFNGDHPRLGFSATGAQVYGSFAYLPVPYVAPYVYGMTTFGKADTKPWEQGGYPEPAYYTGFSTWQLGGGARVRYGIFGDRVWPYGGGGAALVWFARDAMTWDELVMDSWGGRSVGYFGEGGFDFYVRGDGFAAISIGYRYFHLPASYDPAPPGGTADFTARGSFYSACLRLYFM